MIAEWIGALRRSPGRPSATGARPRAAALVLLSAVLFVFCAAGLGGQTAPVGRHALRLEQVVVALSAAMLPLESAEVRLLAQVSATTPNPKLEVKALEPWGDHGARVRMRCETHEQCIPFYVAVDWVDAPTAQAALHAVSSSSPGGAQGSRRANPVIAAAAVRPDRSSDEPMREAASRKVTSESPAVRTAGQQAATVGIGLASATLHAGAHATLLLDGGRLHVKVPVICLESGNTGRTIRVTGVDHKRIYQAEVVDSTLLKGTL